MIYDSYITCSTIHFNSSKTNWCLCTNDVAYVLYVVSINGYVLIFARVHVLFSVSGKKYEVSTVFYCGIMLLDMFYDMHFISKQCRPSMPMV